MTIKIDVKFLKNLDVSTDFNIVGLRDILIVKSLQEVSHTISDLKT